MRFRVNNCSPTEIFSPSFIENAEMLGALFPCGVRSKEDDSGRHRLA